MRALILFVGIAILFFALTMRGNVTKNPERQVTCVNEPDPKHVARYENAIYRRIRTDTPIFYKEVPIHFAPTTPSEIYADGKFRPAYVPWFDGNIDNYYVTWRPLQGVNNLLFVDKTEDRALAESGFHYYDIYLKRDAYTGEYTIPTFVQVYCRSGFSIANRTMFPNQEGEFIPPASINSDDIVLTDGDGSISQFSTSRPPANTEFYIVQYESLGTPMGLISTHSAMPHGDLTVQIGNVTKNYKAYWVPAAMLYFALVDKDTSSPDSQYVYKYTLASEDFQPNFTTTGSNTGAKQNLQLETFNYPILHATGWWTPECKPAIYLYPKEKATIHVTVKPDGYLTYTDPLYPPGGWMVTAYPDGTIFSNGRTYPYLYYESKINDGAIKKPAAGYVVEYDQLPGLFATILPELGLSKKETIEFKDYWEAVLPEANYYFVGVMENEAIDAIEPMKVTPQPDSVVRVRLYFEALDAPKKVPEPVLDTPERKGFVVSEWGGLVKTDKNHPFTCSQ